MHDVKGHADAPILAQSEQAATEARHCRLRIAASMLARLRGLLFRRLSWLGPSGVLVLVPCKSVHTFGMRHALDIAFVDRRGVVCFSARDVGACRVLSCRRAVLVLERFSAPGLPWYEPGEVVSFSPGASSENGA